MITDQTARLVIPDENIPTIVLALCKSNYWVKVESLQDGKSLILSRKETEND
jgi:hypothetical protein